MSDVLPGGIQVGTTRSSAEVLAGARAWLAAHSRFLVATGGRAAVVLMAVSVTTAAAHPLDAGSGPAIALLVGIWLVCLRAAAAEAPVALGPRVPAAVGTFTGLIGVMAINPLIGALQLPLGTVLGMALGVFLSAATWDTVLERVTRRRVLVIGDSAVDEIVAAAHRRSRGCFEVIGATARPAAEIEPPSDAVRSMGVTAERPGEPVYAQADDPRVTADCASSAEKLSYDFWYMRRSNLAVGLAVCVRTLVLMVEIFDPRARRLRRASGDAG